MTYTAEDIEALPRKELQSLAKEYNLKANKKSNELIAELKSILCQELPDSTKEVIINNKEVSLKSEAQKHTEDLNGMIGNKIVNLEPTVVLLNEKISAPLSINQIEGSQNMHQNDARYENLDNFVQVGKSVFITISGEEISGVIKRINKKSVRIILKDGSEVTHPTSDIRGSSSIEMINQHTDCCIEPFKTSENTQLIIQVEDATRIDKVEVSAVSESPDISSHEDVSLEFAAKVDDLLHELTDIPTSPTYNHQELEVTTTSPTTTPNKCLNVNKSPVVIPFSVGRSNMPLISQPTPSKLNNCSFLKSKTPSKDPKYAPNSNKTQIMREDAIRKKSLANYNRAKIPLKSPGSNPIHRKSSITTNSTSTHHNDKDKEIQRKRKLEEIQSIKNQMEVEENEEEVNEDSVIFKVAKIVVDIPPNVSTTRGPFSSHKTNRSTQSQIKSFIPKPVTTVPHGGRQSSSAIQKNGSNIKVSSKSSTITNTSNNRSKITMPDFGKMHERQFSMQKSITSIVPSNGGLAQRMTSALIDAQQPPVPLSQPDTTTGNTITASSSSIAGSINDSKLFDSVTASAKKVTKAAWAESFHNSQTKIPTKDIFADVDKENLQNHNNRMSGNNLKLKGKDKFSDQKQFQRKIEYLSKGKADRSSTISGMRKKA